MSVLQVDDLRFTFSPHVMAEPYDKWHYYVAISGQQKKAVDVVAVENPAAPRTTWLIEAKDFRPAYPPKPSRIGRLAEVVAMKVEDTLLGLEDAAMNAMVASESTMRALPWRPPQNEWCCTWNHTSVLTRPCFRGDSKLVYSRNLGS